MAQVITELGISRRPGDRRKKIVLPGRKDLQDMGPQVSQIIQDSNECLTSIARNLSTKGTIIMEPQQFDTLVMAGVTEPDLIILASLNGLTFSHRVSDIRERMQAIAAVPKPENGAVPWTEWIFQQRDVQPQVHHCQWDNNPLGEVLDRICTVIADRIWENLPDQQYVAQHLAMLHKPVRATEFATALMECHISAGALDPRISITTTWSSKPHAGHGQDLARAKPYPYPNTPLAIQKALAQALDANQYIIDMGEVRDIDTLRREMPDPASLYLNRQGNVWYHRRGVSHHLIHQFLHSDHGEDRSRWPSRESVTAPAEDFTEGEIRLAVNAAPDTPYPTNTNLNNITLLPPVNAAAWLNRITPQQALAQMLNQPDPGAPDTTCPAAGECPTTCAYVQQAGLLAHTLFDDGRYDNCRFRHFRAMHGAKPPEARDELALKMANDIKDRTSVPSQGAVPDHPVETSGKPPAPDDKPRQTALF